MDHLLAATGGATLPGIDIPGLGVAGVLVAILLRVWWTERQDRIAAQQAQLDMLRTTTQALADSAAEHRRLATAIDGLTAEVRRMDDRWRDR